MQPPVRTARGGGRHPHRQRRSHRPNVFVKDPDTGWRARPNLDKVIVDANGGRFRLSTDADGYRLSYPRDERPADHVPVVLVLGDSFAQGVTVEDEETFVWNMAREFTNYRFVNLGVAGYSTVQELIGKPGKWSM